MRNLIIVWALAGLVAVPALAQEPERYRLERTDKGFVRMDTTTGQMAICEENSGQLVCRTSTDERAAYEDRIDDLERRVDALEQQNSSPRTGQRALPSEQEFEQSLGYMRRFFQSFFDIVKEWENDLRPPQAEPTPDRT